MGNLGRLTLDSTASLRCLSVGSSTHRLPNHRAAKRLNIIPVYQRCVHPTHPQLDPQRKIRVKACHRIAFEIDPQHVGAIATAFLPTGVTDSVVSGLKRSRVCEVRIKGLSKSQSKTDAKLGSCHVLEVISRHLCELLVLTHCARDTGTAYRDEAC